jgi:hypothetical protein
MIRSKKRKTPAPSHWWYGIISLVGCVVLSGVVVGHNLPTRGSPQVPQLPTAPQSSAESTIHASLPTPDWRTPGGG